MYEVYVVKELDTLEGIANNYGTTVEELRRINGLSNNYVIRPGTQLVVPVVSKQPYKYYTVQKGDNMYEIAKANDIDYNLLLQLNGLEDGDYIYPNQTIILPKDGLNVYLTKEDDTISQVLRKQGVTIEELLRENNNIYLRPEQILIFRKK